METVEFIIDENGDFTMEVNGVKGSKCRNITKALETLGQVEQQKNKAEAFEIPVPDTLQQYLTE